MKRMMCVWFPEWPIQRRHRSRAVPDPRPLVLFAMAGGKTRVAACSRKARGRGVVPGMLLAEAQALCRGCFEPHDPHADREALRQLALSCSTFSPRIAVDATAAPDCLLLDVTGCGCGFGGEERLAVEAIAALQRRGYWAAAAIADTLGAAWAIAHCALALRTLSRREEDRVIVIPPGRHVEALRPLPVESLRLSTDVVALLAEFDVCRIGQLLELPRADLPSRFGPELLQRLDQALGVTPEPLTPERPAEVFEASWLFEPPVADWQILETVIGRLLEDILDRLRPRQLGVQRLLCSLGTVGQASSLPRFDRLEACPTLRFPVELLRPTCSLRHLTDLVRLHLERLAIPAEVSAVAVRAERVALLELRQGQMFDDSGSARWHEVAALLERLSSRLGEQAVLRPQLREDAQPEFACEYGSALDEVNPNVGQSLTYWSIPAKLSGGLSPEGAVERLCRPFGAGVGVTQHDQGLRPSLLSTAPSGLRPPDSFAGMVHYSVGQVLPDVRTPRSALPSYLKQPLTIGVLALGAGGPPVRFHWRDTQYIVAHFWGPERIETGWWRGADVRRDYYLVETTAGERFWLFRSLTDETWFLHGIFG